MNAIQRLEQWGEAHHPRYLDILRIALGVFLIVKGIEFGNDSDHLSELMARQIPFSSFMILMLTHYILFAHIGGGFLIATGLLTRVACIVQVPILLGALFLVNWDVMGYFSGFFLTLLVLLLVIFFYIVGSGPWSLDKAFEKEAR